MSGNRTPRPRETNRSVPSQAAATRKALRSAGGAQAAGSEADYAAASGVRLYCEEVQRAPRLSPVTARRLLVRIRRGDTKALDAMVLGSLRLVAEVLDRECPAGMGPFALLETGNQALVQAITSFESRDGDQFEDYARSCIRLAFGHAAASA